ncbi:hypothetical protein AAVH_18036 [Aphelenchoides avenae]|nr:hypothetical protein AAVH_18036 [Aphelenchus avenae]
MLMDFKARRIFEQTMHVKDHADLPDEHMMHIISTQALLRLALDPNNVLKMKNAAVSASTKFKIVTSPPSEHIDEGGHANLEEASAKMRVPVTEEHSSLLRRLASTASNGLVWELRMLFEAVVAGFCESSSGSHSPMGPLRDVEALAACPPCHANRVDVVLPRPRHEALVVHGASAVDDAGTNFVCSCVFGSVFFAEPRSFMWCAGVACILLAISIIQVRPREEKKV